MDRLEIVRQVIDEIVRQQPDKEESRCGFVHLYGVSDICVLLAIKRRLDPQLCATAGMLHDIWNYKVWDNPDHARLSSQEAGRILRESGCYTGEEIDRICQAIARHGQKQGIDGEMDELLKDADIFQHYLYNPSIPVKSKSRLDRVFAEFGLDPFSIHVQSGSERPNYILENRIELTHLHTLLNRLSDSDLSQPMPAGWTVSGILAHLAFWDQRALVLLEKWQQEGIGPSPLDVDVVNETTRLFYLAIPARAAAELAISCAENIDKKIAGLSPEMAADVEYRGKTVHLDRASHRREHLGEIERALKL